MIKRYKGNRLMILLRPPHVWISSIVFAGLVINLVLYFWLYAPQQDEIRKMNAEAERLQRELATLQAQHVPAHITADDVERLVRQVPVQSEQSRLIYLLKEMENEAGVTLKTVEFQNTDTELEHTGIVSRSIHIQLQGTYTAAQHVMQLMHEQERLIHATTWRMQGLPMDENDEDPFVQLDLYLHVFLAPGYAAALGDVQP